MFERYIMVLQCITIITGVFCLWRKGPVLLLLILAISILAFINETFLADHTEKWWGISKNVFYNLYALSDIICWSIVFVMMFRGDRLLQRAAMLFGIGLLLFKIREMVAYGMSEFGTRSLTLFCAGCILFAIRYFAGILNADYHNLRTDIAFWICCAALCFYPVLLVNLITVSDSAYWNHSLSTFTFDILQFIATTFYNFFLCMAFVLSFYKHLPVYSRNL